MLSSAQELDLYAAIELAKTNNRSLQNASSDILIARQKRLETIADGLPQISASAGYLNSLINLYRLFRPSFLVERQARTQI